MPYRWRGGLDGLRTGGTGTESEAHMVFGIQDPVVAGAYLLALLGMLACVVYGLLNWNRGDEPAKPEDVRWAQEEKDEIEKKL